MSPTKIISRNIITQFETQPSAAVCAGSCAMQKSFINQPRQLKGCHWRPEDGSSDARRAC
jgi:hypothetical protein